MYSPRIGDPPAALNTPSLLIDLELMESNIILMQERLCGSQVQMRPQDLALSTTPGRQVA